jgi:hypothetical protein
MISREKMLESLAVQEWLEEGRLEGELEGRIHEARSALRLLLESRFPRIRIRPQLDAISDLEALRTMRRIAINTPSAAAFRRAIPQLTRRTHTNTCNSE